MSKLPVQPVLASCTCNRTISMQDLKNYLMIRDAFEENPEAAMKKYGLPRHIPDGADYAESRERYLEGTGKAYAMDCIGYTRMCCRNIISRAPFKFSD